MSEDLQVLLDGGVILLKCHKKGLLSIPIREKTLLLGIKSNPRVPSDRSFLQVWYQDLQKSLTGGKGSVLDLESQSLRWSSLSTSVGTRGHGASRPPPFTEM